MSLDFAVIDLETANSSHASVCQVGLAVVRDGQIAGVHSWYVIPPTGIDSFSASNIRVHGITPETVLGGSPFTWPESLKRIASLVEDLPLVAHNVSFDKTAFVRSTEACGLQAPNYRWLDSVSLSRRHLALENHKLATIIRHFHIENHAHHDAGSDAAVAAQVVLRIADEAGFSSVDSLWPTRSSNGKGPGKSRFYEGGYTASKAELPQPSREANPSHVLYGHRVAITGEVEGYSRGEAFEAIARCGAYVEKGVTKKTSVLVLGHLQTVALDYDLSTGSSKEKKAHTYRQLGQPIMLLGAEDFRRLVGD